MIFLDTHILLWLYDKLEDKFSNAIKELINRNDIYISPISKLELQYLKEIKRINHSPNVIIEFLSRSIGLQVATLSFNDVIDEAMKIKWTRDPFDRIIVSTSKITKSIFITADKIILKNYKMATW